jgi:hypothetical protein
MNAAVIYGMRLLMILVPQNKKMYIYLSTLVVNVIL